MENIKLYIDYIAQIVEAIGVLIIFFGVVISLVNYVISYLNKRPETYVKLRQKLGKAILLGLEVLIAADIMAEEGAYRLPPTAYCLLPTAYCLPSHQLNKYTNQQINLPKVTILSNISITSFSI